MSKKKLTLEDLKKLGNSYGGAQAVTESVDSKQDDAEGAQSGKHGIEYSGTKRTPYISAPAKDKSAKK
jgi:hypothetical protein